MRLGKLVVGLPQRRKPNRQTSSEKDGARVPSPDPPWSNDASESGRAYGSRSKAKQSRPERGDWSPYNRDGRGDFNSRREGYPGNTVLVNVNLHNPSGSTANPYIVESCDVSVHYPSASPVQWASNTIPRTRSKIRTNPWLSPPSSPTPSDSMDSTSYVSSTGSQTLPSRRRRRVPEDFSSGFGSLPRSNSDSSSGSSMKGTNAFEGRVYDDYEGNGNDELTDAFSESGDSWYSPAVSDTNANPLILSNQFTEMLKISPGHRMPVDVGVSDRGRNVLNNSSYCSSHYSTDEDITSSPYSLESGVPGVNMEQMTFSVDSLDNMDRLSLDSLDDTLQKGDQILPKWADSDATIQSIRTEDTPSHENKQGDTLNSPDSSDSDGTVVQDPAIEAEMDIPQSFESSSIPVEPARNKSPPAVPDNPEPSKHAARSGLALFGLRKPTDLLVMEKSSAESFEFATEPHVKEESARAKRQRGLNHIRWWQNTASDEPLSPNSDDASTPRKSLLAPHPDFSMLNDSAYDSGSLSPLTASAYSSAREEPLAQPGKSQDDPNKHHHSSHPDVRPKQAQRTLAEVHLSLQDKVRQLHKEKLLVDAKVRQAREEDRLQQQEVRHFQRQVTLVRKKILLNTLQELKAKLHHQQQRLQGAYDVVLNHQWRHAKQKRACAIARDAS